MFINEQNYGKLRRMCNRKLNKNKKTDLDLKSRNQIFQLQFNIYHPVTLINQAFRMHVKYIGKHLGDTCAIIQIRTWKHHYFAGECVPATWNNNRGTVYPRNWMASAFHSAGRSERKWSSPHNHIHAGTWLACMNKCAKGSFLVEEQLFQMWKILTSWEVAQIEVAGVIFW